MKYLISSMQDKVDDIYMLLKKENIDLSIIVAPWPGSIIHDTKNSRHVKIWKDFCKTKCKNFVNLYPYFFDYSENYGKQETIDKHFFRYLQRGTMNCGSRMLATAEFLVSDVFQINFKLARQLPN